MVNPFVRYKNLLKEYIDERSIPVLYKNWISSYRSYHNLNHLKDIISKLEPWRHKLTQDEFEQLILAAFFHDAIYDPKKPGENEDKSIEFFRKAYIGKDKKFELVDKAIESTKERKRPKIGPLRIFWDADNAGFRGTWKNFLKNEKGIRKEYSYVAEKVYKENRIKFLNENLGVFGPKGDTNIMKLIKFLDDK
jgi:predicted metal-dependent HD superfamily phosphohydrolase